MLTAGSSTFHETFTVTADNPLLRGHLVRGRAILPGVGYVDLALQVLARHGYPMAEVELRNLTIHAPLVVEPGEQVLTTVAGRPAPAGGLRVEISSRRTPDAAEVTHAVTGVHRVPRADFAERLALPLSPAGRLLPLADVYAWFRARELVHSGLMKADGVVHHRADDAVTELELPAAQQGGRADFLFHPALFEAGLLGGGVGIHVLNERHQGDELYLPLVFESFRAIAPLGQRCFVRVPAVSARRDEELFRLAVEFYDADGVKIAEIGQVVAKRVRAEVSLDGREARDPVPAAATPRPAAGSAQAAGADVTALLRELVAARLGVPTAEVGTHVGYYQLGLTSAGLLGLVAELEDRLSLELSPTVVFEHTTIAELAAWLRDRLAQPHPAAPVVTTNAASADAAAAVRAELSSEIASLLDLPVAEVSPDIELVDLGLDLVGRSTLVERLNERYGLALTPAVLLAHPTVRSLAAHLAAPAAEPVAPAAEPVAPGAESTPSRPHPMLHRRLPDDGGVVFSSELDGSEPYLHDHRVRGERVLPAVAQLEAACAAVAAALDPPPGRTVRLHDVVWLRPARAGAHGLELRVSVRAAGAGAAFEITGQGELCCQGRARLVDDDDRTLPDLADARAGCAGPSIPVAHAYDLFAAAGLDHGPALRALTGLRTGIDAAGHPQVLAELGLPDAADPPAGWLLHPAILDGALQAVAGLRLAAATGSARPALPFAVAQVDARATAPPRAHAWVRYQPGSGPDAAQPMLDVTVFDEQGRVCADLVGLSVRALPDPPAVPGPEPVESGQMVEPAPAGSGQMVEPAPAGSGLDIAVIGVSGRYPDAADLDEFWANLRGGRDSVRRVPAGRWEHPRWADADADGYWGGFLDGIDLFDPLFFQISLREAEHLDPHERLFLECAHHVLEDAGYTAELLNRTSGRVGVFAGVMYQDYQLYGAQAQERGQAVALSGSASSVSNRVSYCYGFTGPSLSVDTMCSSSLTAIHLACEAIRSGQCGAAIAGGVNLTAHPNKYLMLAQRGYLSSDGRCRSFGAGGDGYVPGEGVGAVLLKPLAQALADRDHIHAVINGTAVNHGGRTNGYTVPSPVAQSRVVGEALAASGADPRALSYLEAHGTGTALGDPIEIAGLLRAFTDAGCGPAHCAIGSVKSNIGHAESAAGIAGLTKVLLQMRHRELVPSLHADTLNPHIDFTGTPLRVQRDLATWQPPTVHDGGQRRAFPRVAGVSSFGAGGANAHVVLTEHIPPVAVPRPDGGPAALLVLSAMSEAQLVAQARRLSARLDQLTEADLPGVAWTLQTGRTVLPERLAFAANSLAQVRALLDAFVARPTSAAGWVRGTVLQEVIQDEVELAAALDDWSRDGTAARLLRLWATGTAVPWETVWQAYAVGAGAATSLPRRVPLPGYPFARERCWIELAPVEEAAPARVTRQSDAHPVPPEDGLALLRPVWVADPPSPDPALRLPDPALRVPEGVAGYVAHQVAVVGTLTAADRDSLRAALPPGTGLRFVDVVDGPLDQQYLAAARAVFTLLQEVLRPGLPGVALVQVALAQPAVDPAQREQLACLRGLTGMLRTAALENPALRTQLVDCLDGAPADVVAARLVAEAGADPVPEVRHRDGRRHTAALVEVGDGEPGMPWRDGGVYLISGGGGALGRLVASDIAAAVRHATIVLVGRSAPGEELRSTRAALRAAGLTVEHRRADVADRAAVGRLLADVTRDHGPLTGIVHAAGVIDDRLIVGKPAQELPVVLGPKVAGLVNLDELSQDQPLEFLVCLSSISGVFGNVGQADYAAAGAFLDAYAVRRNLLVAAGRRSGRTVSVGWPLWADGGMGAHEAVATRLRALGLAPLDTARGLAVLRRALTDPGAAGDGSLVVLAGRPEAVRRIADSYPAPAPTRAAARDGTDARGHTTDRQDAVADPDGAAGPASGGRPMAERALRHLRQTVAGILKLAPERLHPDVQLERYGMDSVLAVAAVTALEETFGPLPRTLLLERPTLQELAEHLAAEHAAALRALLGEPAPAAPLPPAAPDESPVAASPVPAQQIATAPERTFRAAERRGEFMDVAVIGIAGRYPQAQDLDTFWACLREGRDCVTKPPADRWGDAPGDGAWGGFLDGIDRFDRALFGIAPREAAVMDPQQRLFLETVWELFEGSGVTQDVIARRYGRRVGVYVGAAYQLYRADGDDPALAALTATASYNAIANRVSHFFGLEGASLAVDSMCTSSAMAIHLACADLNRGESELAVAGGVNLATHPDKFLALSQMQLLGTHPGSRSFRDGDGYLPAEAVGAVLLKPLAAALRDGDEVHAVIKGTASLHSGRAGGFLAPSRRAQVTVMRRALEQAGTAADSIGYVESAANGTAMSDEIELSALREVFAGVPAPVLVGSVKSNIGHPEAASGIAQLTKVALQLRHGELTPLTDVGKPNPNVDLHGGPLALCERLTPWEQRTDAQGRPTVRRALINSVAAGGSHVSLVVEAPPQRPVEPPEPDNTGPQLVVLSAADSARLRTAVRRLDEFLDRNDAVQLADVAYTLQVGREALAERFAVVAGDVAELRVRLARYLDPTGGVEAVPGYAGSITAAPAPLLGALEGAGGEAFLAALVADGDLDRLAELWVYGVRIPWRGLHPGRRRLLPLPGTVFDRGSYWLAGMTPATRSAPVAVTPNAPPAPDAVAVTPDAPPAPDAVAETVREVCAQVLGFPAGEVGLDDSFTALGGHSLLAHRFAALLAERGLPGDPAAILGARTLAAVAEAVRPVTTRPAPADGPTRLAVVIDGTDAQPDAGADRPPVPGGIPAGTTRITPDLLPLVTLTEQEIATIVAAVPGGAANVQDVYPLAPLQEGMYFHHLKESAHDPYVSSGLFSFADRDRLDSFARALQAVIVRHDALRTIVLADGLSRPVQAVLRQATLAVEEIALHDGDSAAQQLGELLRDAPRMPLDQAPLVRLRAGRHPGTGGWYAALSLHHIIHDAASLGLLLDEIVACMEGRAEALPAPVPYRAFIAHPRPAELDPAAFFGPMLADVDEPTVVFGLPDVHGDGQEVLELRRPLDEALSRRVAEVAARLRTSPATLFHAGWALAVASWSDRDDVTFGTVLSGRTQGPAGVERMVGSFINTLPMRLDLAGRSVRELVGRVEELLHELVRHEQVALTEARAHCGLPADAPLFNAIFNYRRMPADGATERLLARVGVTPLSGVVERSNYPVTVSVDDLGDGYEVEALVDRAQDANVVIDCLEAAVAAVVAALSEQDGAAPALSLPVLPAAMQHREVATYAWEPVAIEEGVATADAQRMLPAWFEDVARQAPEMVAVRCAGRVLTYGELNAHANRLARQLRELGVGRESLVALCLPRSEWLVVSALAVVKAGGAYVPLDPSAPVERLGHVLGDSAPQVLLVDGAAPAGLDTGAALVLDVPGDAARRGSLSADDLDPVAGASPSDLAYVIYTSGSTGKPKGVMIEHRHVVRFFLAAQEWFDYRPGDVWTLFHSFAFDFTVWEMWGALLHRGHLVVVTQEVARSPQDFYRLLCVEGVTVLGQTPTGFGQLISAQGEDPTPHRVRTVVLGGEELDASALGPWFKRPVNAGTRLVNMWGTTETTVVTTYRQVTEPDTRLTTRPIGGPMPGLSVYVLDRHQRPTPTGAVGELVIGGEAVGRGYLNRPELTAQRFLHDPFSNVPGARMYRTGDLGRRLPDGSLEFLGRNDDQVKVRGYRIELGEITTRLNEHPAVADARVVVRGQGDDRRLVGYLVPAARLSEPAEQALRTELDAALRAVLPPYMVPSGYVLLDRLPLTGNGKLDTRALPAPALPQRTEEQGTAPRTEAEQVVSEVWAELLNTDAGQLGVESNFFSLGGNSLLVTRMINMIKRRTGVELRVQTIFDARQLADLAAAVARDMPDTKAAVPLNLDAISSSIDLIENMTDAELDALDTADAVRDAEHQAGGRP
ncbi:amino acid adenylation domain-containing protein [Micromonospora sp. FIMYZ51]|uniref:amino acid adenylation domain-containing protein n=1 Tax=Micromonospora sp. FIMYZ51 TaxID=3051832 RepID=UPI00311E73CB